ncbi:MAG: YicC family protein [Thermoanaerobacterales bacterium]|jgi:uncharacterized protein (TIGR00255 family)|nr:YicC family protein [Thermoanaerobacterales bacterium]
MIKSMTGYGRGETSGDLSWTVDIRSSNHRFLDVHVKLPKPWLFLEERIKSYIKEKISRGRVDVFVNLSCDNLPVDIKIDKAAINNYHKKLIEIKRDIGFEGPVSLPLLSIMPDVFTVEEVLPKDEDLWLSLEPALTEAVNNLMIMKKTEGSNLWEDIVSRLDVISKSIVIIEKNAGNLVGEYRKKLLEHIQDIAGDIRVDEERLEAEVIFFADKCDITEEIVRLRSHISQFKDLETKRNSIGKKMDFIVQEMFRETNTIGSKSSQYTITREVIEIKAELEKIREQIQNIE